MMVWPFLVMVLGEGVLGSRFSPESDILLSSEIKIKDTETSSEIKY